MTGHAQRQQRGPGGLILIFWLYNNACTENYVVGWTRLVDGSMSVIIWSVLFSSQRGATRQHDRHGVNETSKYCCLVL